MNEIVERAALALYLDGGGRVEWWNSEPPWRKAKFEKPARAVIEAMRHPACDAAMMDAGMKAVIFGGSPDSVAWNVFHVMIDAALAGAPTARPSPSTGSASPPPVTIPIAGGLDEILEPLGELYSQTGADWDLSLNHCLTEPTCPSASITPEGWRIARYRVDCDRIEDSLREVVALVRREVIERQVVGSSCPFTNPDDKAFAEWLERRAAGSDEHLPEAPTGPIPEYLPSPGTGSTEL